MRITGPIMIVLLAVLIYASRDRLIQPMVGSGADISGDIQTSGAVEDAGMALDLPVDTGDDDGMTIVAASTGSSPAMNTSGTKPKEGKIRRNSSLYVELRDMGVSPQDIDGVVRASRKIYNLKRVRPGQRFEVYAGADDRLDSLTFHITREEHLVVRRGDAKGFSAAIEEIPYSVTFHMTNGTIESSIFAALSRQNAETDLAGALDQIFGWSINFFSDIRRGDTFVILYERKEFGDGTSALGEILAARIVNKGEEYHAFRFAPTSQGDGYYDLKGNSLQKSLRRSPLKFNRITSRFSGKRFHPIYKTYRPHYGVDFGAPRGTPVYATGDGIVQVAGRHRGNGNYVKIKHNQTYTTYYLHLNGFARGIRSGVRVKQGQLIGYVGSTGAATAPHVCYRIKRNGNWVNPSNLKLPSKAPVPPSDTARFERVRDTYLYGIKEALATSPGDATIALELRSPLMTRLALKAPPQ